mmetsp:Transcript_2923/g.4515  ORF Transcript_2923/g.4515 Transcript_2923/m.4515 type:complete len:96 (-) Transcript_2923:4351-4638(-)
MSDDISKIRHEPFGDEFNEMGGSKDPLTEIEKEYQSIGNKLTISPNVPQYDNNNLLRASTKDTVNRGISNMGRNDQGNYFPDLVDVEESEEEEEE